MHNACERVTRNVALQAFSTFETRQQTETLDMLYPAVLTRVHAAIARHFELETTRELDDAFGRSVPQWPAFADTADALRILKRHYRLVILSNVHRDGFAASSRKLGVDFDAIYTAQDVGSYKPNSANFDYLLSHLRDDLGLENRDVLHTAQSLHHDHVPARTHGLANAWIDRQRLSEGGQWGATAVVDEQPDSDFLFFSMMEMANAVERARA
jgi:2-haloalkanoic acid dehalogenase type II